MIVYQSAELYRQALFSYAYVNAKKPCPLKEPRLPEG